MNGICSLPEAATMLGKSYQAVWNAALAGRLGPLRRFGRNYVLDVAAVEAVRAKEQGAEASPAPTPVGSVA